MQDHYYESFTSGSEFIAPNVYLHQDAECDILRLLKSGYCEEIEIKISFPDFKNDFKKVINTQTFAYKVWGKNRYMLHDKLNKHEAIACGKTHVNRFYFYIPWYLKRKG